MLCQGRRGDWRKVMETRRGDRMSSAAMPCVKLYRAGPDSTCSSHGAGVTITPLLRRCTVRWSPLRFRPLHMGIHRPLYTLQTAAPVLTRPVTPALSTRTLELSLCYSCAETAPAP